MEMCLVHHYSPESSRFSSESLWSIMKRCQRRPRSFPGYKQLKWGNVCLFQAQRVDVLRPRELFPVWFYLKIVRTTTPLRQIAVCTVWTKDRTAYSRRGGESVESGRAVYNNNMIQWRHLSDSDLVQWWSRSAHRQHAIFGKRLHHRSATVALVGGTSAVVLVEL